MELVSMEPAEVATRQFVVKSIHFEAQHTVGIALLRPPFAWSAEGGASGTWGLRDPPEVHMVGGRQRFVVEEEEKAGRAKRRKKEEDPRQLGQPKDKAAHFGSGTKRKGVDGRIWEVRMTDKLAEVWCPVVTKSESTVRPPWEEEEEEGGRKRKGKARAEAEEEGGGEEEEEEELVDGDRRDIALEPVLENELRAAGISAKKGYEDLVYEAMVHLMGEGVVATHAPGSQGTAERRLWCKALCPGCEREINLLVVPGLDVVQCCYCSLSCFTNPPPLSDLSADGSARRNANVDDALALLPPDENDGVLVLRVVV